MGGPALEKLSGGRALWREVRHRAAVCGVSALRVTIPTAATAVRSLRHHGPRHQQHPADWPKGRQAADPSQVIAPICSDRPHKLDVTCIARSATDAMPLGPRAW